MGEIISIFGLGGSNAKPISNNGGKILSYRQAKYTKHAKDTVITGGKVGFMKETSDLAFKKRFGGKEKFRLKNGETMNVSEIKKEVGRLKKQYKNLSGEKIKKKFSEMGLKYKDAEQVAIAATLDYIKPESLGLSSEQKARNIKIGRISQSLGGGGRLMDLQEKRDARNVKSRAENTDSSRIGAKQAEYKVGALGRGMSEGDLRGGASDDYSGDTTGFAGGEKGEAASVASGFGVKKKEPKAEDDTIPIFQSFGQTDDYNIKKVI